MKKAKLLYTPQGYSYIQVTTKDCLEWGGLTICDDCNNPINDDGHLIYILNRVYCKKCFEDWCHRATKYSDDIMLQKQNHINYYKAYGFEVQE